MGLHFRLFKRDRKIMKVMFIFPNKDFVMKDVDVTMREFKPFPNIDRTFALDEKAILYFKGKPILLYHVDCASPMIVKPTGIEFSMNSGELNAMYETTAVKDLLTAEADSNKLLMWLIIGCLAGVAVIIMIITGMIKVGISKGLP